MAKKRIAHKIEIHVDEAGGTSFTKLLSVKRITDSGLERESVNMDCLDSIIEDNHPSPILKIGDVGLQVFWDEADTDHQRLVTLINADPQPLIAARPAFKIVFNFATPIEKTFRGWVKSLGETPYEVKGEVMRDVVLVVTTKPVTA